MQYVTELNFEIILKNDNLPYCIVNNGLNVVVGGDKILSDKDLLYGDADIDAKPETISYTRRAIPYGTFTLSDPPYNQLFEFTQVTYNRIFRKFFLEMILQLCLIFVWFLLKNDINNGRVMFRHNGPLSGNISMWVSDGKNYSEFNFQIIASAPYIKIINNSKLLLRQGGETVLTKSNLFSSTNMNVPAQLIRLVFISL